MQGSIVPRPSPQSPHSILQGFLIFLLDQIARPLGFHGILPGQRLKTSPDRYRIPDICLTRAKPEILSPEDTVMQLRAKIAEYLAFGAEYVWVVDPEICTGEIHNAQSKSIASATDSSESDPANSTSTLI